LNALSSPVMTFVHVVSPATSARRLSSGKLRSPSRFSYRAFTLVNATAARRTPSLFPHSPVASPPRRMLSPSIFSFLNCARLRSSLAKLIWCGWQIFLHYSTFYGTMSLSFFFRFLHLLFSRLSSAFFILFFTKPFHRVDTRNSSGAWSDSISCPNGNTFYDP